MVLSLWPALLSYPFLGIFIIRIVLGFIFIHLGYTVTFGLKNRAVWVKTAGLISFLVGIFLVIGLFTQVVALVAALIAILAVIIKIRAGHALERGLDYYLLVLAIALALLFLGPGSFAIDLPL